MRGVFAILFMLGGVIALSMNGMLTLRKVLDATGIDAPIVNVFVPPEDESPKVDEPRKQVYYQFIDDGGAVRFASSRDEIPERWRERAGRIEMSGPPPTTPGEARSIRETRASRVIAATRAKQPQITMYSTQTCGVCKKARAYMDSKDISYVDKDVDTDPEAGQEFRAKGGRGVPLIEIDGEVMRGFDQDRFDEILAAKS